MSFLFGVLSLKKMASVKLCGSLWSNEKPIRDFLVSNAMNMYDDWEDDDERISKIEINLYKNLSILGLPTLLEKELLPVIQQMGRNLFHFHYGFGVLFTLESQDFYFDFLKQVRFTNRGDVDIYASTKRHLQEDGALIKTKDRSYWVKLVGHPDEIRANLIRIKNKLSIGRSSDEQESNLDDPDYKLDDHDRYWIQYLNLESFDSSHSGPVATNKDIFEHQTHDGFRQNIDFAFSFLTKSEKLEHIDKILNDKRLARLRHAISPSGWAYLILQLDSSEEREEFYEECGYAILICIIRLWTHHDLFEAAVLELVKFLTLDQFEDVALQLASSLSRSVRPYDKSIGDMFLFFWQAAPEDIRREYLERDEEDLPILVQLLSLLSRERLANVEPRCFAMVISDLIKFDLLREFLLTDEGLKLCRFLIDRQSFECLKYFRHHVSIALLAQKLQVLHKNDFDVFELYHWIHGKY